MADLQPAASAPDALDADERSSTSSGSCQGANSLLAGTGVFIPVSGLFVHDFSDGQQSSSSRHWTPQQTHRT